MEYAILKTTVENANVVQIKFEYVVTNWKLIK